MRTFDLGLVSGELLANVDTVEKFTDIFVLH